MKDNNLLIFGAGGLGKAAAEVAELSGAFKRICFLDDTDDTAIDKFENFRNYIEEYNTVFVAVENVQIRMMWLHRLSNETCTVATLVHPRAIISPSARIHPGTLIMAGTVVGTNAEVNGGCIIYSGVLVECDANIQDGSVLMTGAVIGPRTWVYAGEIIQAGEIRVYRPKPDFREKYGNFEYSFDIGN